MLSSLLVCLAALLPWTPNDPCPHQITELEPQEVTVGPDLGCGVGTARFQGAEVSLRSACPSFVLIKPPRDVPKSMPNSNTMAIAIGTVEVTKIEYTCATSWFLIIPIGSRCQLKRSSVVGRLATYGIAPCPACPEPRGPSL